MEEFVKKMSMWGVGPKIMLPSYLILMILSFAHLRISISGSLNMPRSYLSIAAWIIICIGIIILLIADLQIRNALKENQLFTKGIFSVIRNPIYAAHIFFIMPGFCLLSDNILTALSLLCAGILFNILIAKEEKVLDENFGEKYREYKSKVSRLLPRSRI